MRRSARVLAVDLVSMPDSGEGALRVLTDLPRAGERAFYLRPDSPRPEADAPIAWGDHRAWYQVGCRTVVAWKQGYNFDPEAPLR